MLLLSQRILFKEVGICGIENFLVGMAWGFARVSHETVSWLLNSAMLVFVKKL